MNRIRGEQGEAKEITERMSVGTRKMKKAGKMGLDGVTNIS